MLTHTLTISIILYTANAIGSSFIRNPSSSSLSSISTPKFQERDLYYKWLLVTQAPNPQCNGLYKPVFQEARNLMLQTWGSLNTGCFIQVFRNPNSASHSSLEWLYHQVDNRHPRSAFTAFGSMPQRRDNFPKIIMTRRSQSILQQAPLVHGDDDSTKVHELKLQILSMHETNQRQIHETMYYKQKVDEITNLLNLTLQQHGNQRETNQTYTNMSRVVPPIIENKHNEPTIDQNPVTKSLITNWIFYAAIVATSIFTMAVMCVISRVSEGNKASINLEEFVIRRHTIDNTDSH